MEYRKPTWAKKVDPLKIKKLYEQDAKGIYDEELINDVGMDIYARVVSVLTVTLSNLGKATCVECQTEIPHTHSKEFVLVCPKCGWTMLFKEYGDSYKQQTLNGFGAQEELKDYKTKYPSAKTYSEKMMLIDALIHTFHGNLNEHPSRPTATNIIDGSNAEVANLIFNLAYGEGSVAAREELNLWLEKYPRSLHKYINPASGRRWIEEQEETIK